MRTRTFSILLIAALSGSGIASAQTDQRSSDPKAGAPRHDDVQVTVTTGRGRLGFTAIHISRELRAHLGAPSDRGVLVDAVRPDSPAARAGLQVGDIVIDVDGDATRSASDVLGALSDRKTGDEVPIAVIRDGHRVDLRAKLDTNPDVTWRSNGLRNFQGAPDHWFPLDREPQGVPQDMQDAINELRKRMQDLEHRYQQPPVRSGLDRI
jgi:serine protease Do